MHPMPSNSNTPLRPGEERHVQPGLPVVWLKGDSVHTALARAFKGCQGQQMPGGADRLGRVGPLRNGAEAAGKAGGLSGCSARVGHEEKSMKKLTADRLRELLSYDPDVGVFIRRTCSGGCLPGSIAGTDDKEGYLLISVDGRRYKSHRLAWLYVYGAFPLKELDHINQIKDDNRIANLREVTTSENQQNKSIQSNNTSGFRGVGWNKEKSRWVARIAVNLKRKHLGFFKNLEDAINAYRAAAAVLHTHNKISVAPVNMKG